MGDDTKLVEIDGDTAEDARAQSRQLAAKLEADGRVLEALTVHLVMAMTEAAIDTLNDHKPLADAASAISSKAMLECIAQACVGTATSIVNSCAPLHAGNCEVLRIVARSFQTGIDGTIEAMQDNPQKTVQ